jgi:integrase
MGYCYMVQRQGKADMGKNLRLTDELVAGLTADPAKAAKGGDTFYWDRKPVGFGLKVTPAGQKVFIYVYKVAGRTRRLTLGNVARISASAARVSAQTHEVAVRNGRDPQSEKLERRAAQTIREHAEAWIALLRARARRGDMSARTVEDYASKLRLHIIPAFGTKKPADLHPRDIKAWRDRRLAQQPEDGTTATGRRCLGSEGVKGTLRVLSTLCTYLREELEIITTNPAEGLGQFTTRTRERFLTADEMARLGAALDARREQSPHMVAVIELALFTGMRRGEILDLRWEDVREDERTIVLTRHKTHRKTGTKRVPLNDPALEVLKRANGWRREGNPFVFPSQAHRNIALVKSGMKLSSKQLSGRMSEGGLKREWLALRKKAGLAGSDALRFHDLRHTYASVGVSNGVSLAVIGRNLGHKSPQTTARYAHIYDDAASVANARVGAEIRQRMSKSPSK